jgi:hypothetical protein
MNGTWRIYGRKSITSNGAVRFEGVSLTTANHSCLNPGVIFRKYTIIDECGNESNMTQLIELEDTTAPDLLNVPNDTTVQCATQIPPMPNVIADDQDPVVVLLLREPGLQRIAVETLDRLLKS